MFPKVYCRETIVGGDNEVFQGGSRFHSKVSLHPFLIRVPEACIAPILHVLGKEGKKKKKKKKNKKTKKKKKKKKKTLSPQITDIKSAAWPVTSHAFLLAVVLDGPQVIIVRPYPDKNNPLSDSYVAQSWENSSLH